MGRQSCFFNCREDVLLGRSGTTTTGFFQGSGRRIYGTTSSEGIIQAPYFARMKWVTVLEESRLSHKEWEQYLRQSYELVKAKLPKKIQESIS
jgi:hypothetical protein